MRRSVRSAAFIFTLMACSTAAAKADAPRLVLVVRPAFVPLPWGNEPNPLGITLANRGESVDGVLSVLPQTYPGAISAREYSVRISLPSGSTKRMLVYPVLGGSTRSVSVTYTGSFRGQMMKEVDQPEQRIGGLGFIGDRDGAGWAFLALMHRQNPANACGDPLGPRPSECCPQTRARRKGPTHST